ncbi:MAG: hypothetical protein H6883_13650 [Rhodobiaceae bacterium]|nr:hypothetical protein [Rhodobiaceae bacterium]
MSISPREDSSEILREISLREAAPGSLTTVIGPSGISKRRAAACCRPAEAEREPWRKSDIARRRPAISDMSSGPNLMPWAGIIENIRLPLRP